VTSTNMQKNEVQTTEEKALIEDEKLLMDLSRIVYREKISENPNVKNYNIAHYSDFYYMDQHLINAAAQQTAEKQAAEASTVQEALEEVQTFCKYDEVCSQQKMCGDCAIDKYERVQYEEGWENFKVDNKCQCDDE
jgi:hypothetical protein